MIGKVAKCRHNKIGIITDIKTKIVGCVDVGEPITEPKLYIGIGFDGKPWQSKYPTILANSVNEYLAMQMDETPYLSPDEACNFIGNESERI